MTDKSKDKDSETLDSCFSPSVILDAFLFLSSSTFVIEDPGSLPFPSFVRRTTLDSCFRRNDRRKGRNDRRKGRNNRREKKQE